MTLFRTPKFRFSFVFHLVCPLKPIKSILKVVLELLREVLLVWKFLF